MQLIPEKRTDLVAEVLQILSVLTGEAMALGPAAPELAFVRL